MDSHVSPSSPDEIAPTVEETLLPGATLGRYQLLRPIASGGMGMVWAARHRGQLGFKKLVAIKTALPDVAKDPEFQRMFLDEARIASAIQHPNVCSIYELGEEGETLYLAMEWVNGDSLSHLLRAFRAPETLDPRVAAKILSLACAGLHAAHELRGPDDTHLCVVHRDVSPHNLLLSTEGQVKVADFGVAKAHGQLHKSTLTGELKGKVWYMAPEQVIGHKIDRRADVFALGCVLYQATTGQRPFEGTAALTTMYRILEAQFRRPSEVLEGYPSGLETIVMRALARQPEDRYATAEELAVALDRWILETGPLVTEAHVAEVVRQRLGPSIARRKQLIREAATGLTQTDATGALTATDVDEASGPTARGSGRRLITAISGDSSSGTRSNFSILRTGGLPVKRVGGAVLLVGALSIAGAGFALFKPGPPPSAPAAIDRAAVTQPVPSVPLPNPAGPLPPPRGELPAVASAARPDPPPAPRPSAPVAQKPRVRPTRDPASEAARPAPSSSAAPARTIDGLADRK